MMAPPKIADVMCSFCGREFGTLVDPRTCPECKRSLTAEQVSRIIRSGMGIPLGTVRNHCVICTGSGVSIAGREGTVHLDRNEVATLARVYRTYLRARGLPSED